MSKSLEDSTRVNVLVFETNGVSDNDQNFDEELAEDKNDESLTSNASSNSSLEKLSPFETRFDINLGPNVTKNGNIIMFEVI